MLLSPGYGIPHTGYGFLATHLSRQGYVVIAVQHDLPSDPPLAGKGDLITLRTPAWERGADNLRFVKNEMSEAFPDNDWSDLTLIGHSNGGDISSFLLQASPDFATTLITLDHRRVPLPRDPALAVLSIRASDFPADPGVLPSETEDRPGNACVVEIPNSRHNEMHDGGPAELKSQIKDLIDQFLRSEAKEKGRKPALFLVHALVARLSGCS
ncbi:alpha/beta fold hydrolase [Arenimonas alkanexedens]